MFNNPDVRTEITIPAITPPDVSIENDLPGTKSLAFLAADMSFTNTNPDAMQNGIITRKVRIIPARNDGVSPGSKKSLDKKINSTNEMKGVNEKMRLILFISFMGDFPANEAPIPDAINQEPRNVPAISSYPPVKFMISLISKS